MWDSMMSPEERDRLNRRQNGDGHGRPQFNRTAIAVALAISTRLRRLWLFVSVLVLVGPSTALVVWIVVLGHLIQESNAGVWLAIIACVSIPWGFWGIGLWIRALFIRWIGRKARTDHADDQLFNR